jgi:ribosomal-protein-alanine N-acetyltransferase
MLQPNFTPFPELITQRLLLRKITPADADEIFFLRSDAEVLKYLGREPCASRQEAEAFIERITNDLNNNDGVAWAITLKSQPEKMIGQIGFWRMDKAAYRSEVGYVLNPAYWRKGIMKEALGSVMEYGFNTMGLHSAEARISPANIASASLLESSGFIKEGYLKESFCFREEFEDTVIYSKVKSL